jgi:2,3-bisphosphoglycerate-independent phosphoglycerate mutase
MDRDTRWERTAKAFDALVHGEGEAADSVQAGVEAAYARGQTDEFLEPLVIDAEARVRPNDPVVFFNFRNDRPRQLTSALTEEAFTEFERGGFTPARLTTLTEYDPAYPVAVAFAPERPETCLAEVVSQAGIGQFHCAETEKYAHVTFFLNGGQEAAVPGEARKMIPSPKVATYDLQPEMSAAGVADAVIEAMRSDDYGLVVVNFANGDMVGHTAVPEAVLEAVRVLDREVGRVLDAAVEAGFSVLLTADHGNCDEYVDPQSGEPHTQHTLYPVPCLIIDREYWRLLTGGGLTNVAPTVLELMGLEAPAAMKARSLLLGVSPT